MTYDNNMKGAIWANDRREKDTHPHFKGDALIDGVEYYVSAWKRDPEGNPKAPALKFSFTRKDNLRKVVNEAVHPENAAPMPDQDFDDDIPF